MTSGRLRLDFEDGTTGGWPAAAALGREDGIIYGTAHCDACGRRERLHGPEHLPEGWARLERKATPNHPAIAWDLCLGCIAKASGWGNPVAARRGSAGQGRRRGASGRTRGLRLGWFLALASVGMTAFILGLLYLVAAFCRTERLRDQGNRYRC